MSLLTYDYNPNAQVALLVQAMQAGQAAKHREQEVIAGMAKAIADDRRHALEWDRLRAFEDAKFSEGNRRYQAENAPFTIPRLPETAPVTAETPGVPPSEIEPPSLPSEEPAEVASDTSDTGSTKGYTEILAEKRAEQLQQGLDAVRKSTPQAPQGFAPPDLAGPLPADPQAHGWEPPASLMPEQKVGATLRGLASLNQPGQPPVIRNKDVRAALPSIIRSSVTPARGSSGGAPESIDQITAGMEFVPENGTYRNKAGAEYFVSRSASGKVSMKAFQPTKAKASRWVQGSDGRAYALGTDGQPMQPIPEGVDLQFSAAKPSTFRDDAGNTYLMKPSGERELIVPSVAKMSAAESSKYSAALAAKRAGEAEVAAKEEAASKSWFGVGSKAVEEAKTKVRDADAMIETMRERYPKLREQVKPAPSSPAASVGAPEGQGNPSLSLSAEDKAASLANAKAAAEKKPEATAAIRQRMLAAGFTEQELQAAGL
jgi:hypothetical protein